MKRIVFSLAVLMIYVPAFSVFAADKKAQAANREPANAKLPDDCLKIVQQVAAAAGGPFLGNEPADFSVSAVKVTHTGPPPSPADGPNMALAYKGNIQISGNPAGTFSVRIVRGGCMLTHYNE